MSELLRADLNRAKREIGGNALFVILFRQGFWALLSYRFRRAWHRSAKSRIELKLKTLGCRIINLWTEILTGITLPPEAEIGGGLLIPHFGPIVVNTNAVIGDNCLIHQGVTVGQAGRGLKRGAPRIGNRVYVGANALILGKITIGNDAVIGAGAVVVKDVPEAAVVVGNPAKIVSYAGSFDLIEYDGMNDDVDRAESLANHASASYSESSKSESVGPQLLAEKAA